MAQHEAENEAASLLMKAAQSGDNHLLKAMMDRGVSPEFQDEIGRTALMEAIFNQHIVTAITLANHMLRWDQQDKLGNHALGILCSLPGDCMTENKRKETIVLFNKLMTCDADINQKDLFGQSLLGKTIEANNLELATYIVSSGADATHKQLESLLLASAAAGNVRAVDVCLHRGVDINTADAFGRTPLMRAIGSNNPGTALHLMVKGADISKADAMDTSLLQVFLSIPEDFTDNSKRLLREEVFKRLMRAEKSADLRSQRGSRLLHTALIAENYPQANHLILKGASLPREVLHQQFHKIVKMKVKNKVSVLDRFMGTLMDIFYQPGKENEVKDFYLEILLERGMDIKTANVVSLTQKMLKMGADVDTFNEKKQTPLMEAILSENLILAELLVKNGANVHLRTPQRETAATLLCKLKDSSFEVDFDKSKVALMHCMIKRGLFLKPEDPQMNKAFKTGLLSIALKSQNWSLAKVLLENGAEKGLKVGGKNLLDYAQACGAKDFTKYLLENLLSASYAHTDQPGENYQKNSSKREDMAEKQKELGIFLLEVVTLSCDKRIEDLMQHLMQQGADVNVKDAVGKTPLMRAIQSGNLRMALMLIEKGADVTIKDQLGNDAMGIFFAAPRNRNFTRSLEAAEPLLLGLMRNGKIKQEDSFDERLVFKALRNENPEPLKRLFALKISIKKAALDQSLFYAVHQKDHDLLLKVLDKGADINRQNDIGRTPLMEAIAKGELAMASTLIARGANIFHRDPTGIDALWLLCALPPHPVPGFDTSLRERVFVQLKKSGADLKYEDIFGKSIYALAAEHDNIAIGKSLLYGSYYSAFELMDAAGKTPLMMACAMGNKKDVKQLLEKGVSVHAADHAGRTCLDYAIAQQQWDLVAKLILRDPTIPMQSASRHQLAEALHRHPAFFSKEVFEPVRTYLEKYFPNREIEGSNIQNLSLPKMAMPKHVKMHRIERPAQFPQASLQCPSQNLPMLPQNRIRMEKSVIRMATKGLVFSRGL